MNTAPITLLRGESKEKYPTTKTRDMERKIKITLLALLAVTLTGCGQEQLGTNNRLDKLDEIMKAEYEGHSYIIYKGYNKGGITHDPDCPCQKGGAK